MTAKTVWSMLSGFEQRLGKQIYIERKEKSPWIDELNALEGELRTLRRLIGKSIGQN